MAWVESQSPSFAARHESGDVDAAQAVLDALEAFRSKLERLFPRTPGEVAVILHPRPFQLALAHPWLPLARLVAAPASRRYFAGWFAKREIHVLAPAALEARASSVEGSREALLLTPLHEYAHLVVGANNPELPPPFNARSFARYLRWAWLCEGAATHLSGQTPHLRAAVVRRLREEGRPQFPPSARDAALLGATLFAVLEQEQGVEACVELATSGGRTGAPRALTSAFDRPTPEIERRWRHHLDSYVAS